MRLRIVCTRAVWNISVQAFMRPREMMNAIQNMKGKADK